MGGKSSLNNISTLMIQTHTQLVVIDNSGAQMALCINVLGGKVAHVGDTVVVTIKQ